MAQKLPDLSTHFADWYQEVIYQAELVDQSPVRGAYIIRPYAWQMWELIKQALDKKISASGSQNCQFPLFIPMSFIEKEAKHVEGFAPELAVVTHAGGKELEEPLVVRPTSETIIHHAFSRWITSWRDLPYKINQWANIVRWEMRPRPFLRTTEFFWQEGHTAHETEDEARTEVQDRLDMYVDLIENHLAIPTITGEKSAHERFAGAEKTLTVEGIMQDGKALQMGTSHLLSQDFAKSFDIAFQDREGKQAHPWLASWGVTTRLIGALIMTHGDQKGLIIPPRIAPIQVVIVPIYKTDEQREKILDLAHRLQKQMPRVRFHVDADDHKTPGAKFFHWELRGVPVRMEIGPRDLEQGQVVLADRTGLFKKSVSFENLDLELNTMLSNVQDELLRRAKNRMDEYTHTAEKLVEFGPKLEKENGAYRTGWCTSEVCEQALKKYKATIRCLLNSDHVIQCFNCDAPSEQDVLVAKAY